MRGKHEANREHRFMSAHRGACSAVDRVRRGAPCWLDAVRRALGEHGAPVSRRVAHLCARRRLGVPLVARAGAAGSPRVAALPGHLERRAHLGDRPGPLAGLDERELSPLHLRAYSCLLAKKALAFKSISLSLFSRSLSRLSLRRSSAIWKGLSPAGACAASALLTRSGRLPGSTPGSRAASA